MRKRWTIEETDRLLAICREHTRSELSRIFGRSEASIKSRLFQLGVPCKYDKQGAPKRRTDEERKAIRHEWYEKNKKRLAEYQKAYYEELKSDEEAYAIFKLKHNERKRKSYARKKAKTNYLNKEVIGRCETPNVRVGECIGF